MVISLMDGPLAMIDHKKQLSKSVDFIVKVLQINNKKVISDKAFQDFFKFCTKGFGNYEFVRKFVNYTLFQNFRLIRLIYGI